LSNHHNEYVSGDDHEYDFQRTLLAKSTNMSIPVWAVLAFATWTIAILILGVGVYRWSLILAGTAELKSFPGDSSRYDVVS
jgi:ABC-type multidrug transport system permease subunit